VKFPSAGVKYSGFYFLAYVEELARAAKTIDSTEFDRAAATLEAAYVRGARVFMCGNGGSASIANHMQCDHMKGVRTSTDLNPRVHSLSSSAELISGIANDMSYEDVFVYQLQSLAEAGDVLVAVSSTGRSPNVIRAIDWANGNGVRSIAVTGFDGGLAARLARVSVRIDSTNYGVVEDLSQSVLHALAQYIRQQRMSEDQIASSTF